MRQIRAKKRIHIKKKDTLLGKAYSFEIKVRNCIKICVSSTVGQLQSKMAMEYYKLIRKRSGENKHALMLETKNLLPLRGGAL